MLIHPQLKNTHINTQHPHTYGKKKREEISMEGGLGWSKEGDLLGDCQKVTEITSEKRIGEEGVHTGNIKESEVTGKKKESRIALWSLAWMAKQRGSTHGDWASIRKARTEKQLTAR